MALNGGTVDDFLQHHPLCNYLVQALLLCLNTCSPCSFKPDIEHSVEPHVPFSKHELVIIVEGEITSTETAQPFALICIIYLDYADTAVYSFCMDLNLSSLSQMRCCLLLMPTAVNHSFSSSFCKCAGLLLVFRVFVDSPPILFG